MNKANELQKKQYERMMELSNLAIERRKELEAAGDTRKRTGRKGDDHLTEEERQEFFNLGRQVFGVTVKDGFVHCQGKSWKLPENSSLIKNEVEA
ncbi:hypothetical protein ACE1B6_18015 [Aerosakkonemataceae cyanobacterium BLCC-F154]|uniref:Uncharacterized protein n=1 Tax=Floridaenema fluviatile BLCC-F154 TaxID=3153640 RepID=A0ABV4YE92_9CYAN